MVLGRLSALGADRGAGHLSRCVAPWPAQDTWGVWPRAALLQFGFGVTRHAKRRALARRLGSFRSARRGRSQVFEGSPRRTRIVGMTTRSGSVAQPWRHVSLLNNRTNASGFRASRDARKLMVEDASESVACQRFRCCTRREPGRAVVGPDAIGGDGRSAWSSASRARGGCLGVIRWWAWWLR